MNSWCVFPFLENTSHMLKKSNFCKSHILSNCCRSVLLCDHPPCHNGNNVVRVCNQHIPECKTDATDNRRGKRDLPEKDTLMHSHTFWHVSSFGLHLSVQESSTLPIFSLKIFISYFLKVFVNIYSLVFRSWLDVWEKSCVPMKAKPGVIRNNALQQRRRPQGNRFWMALPSSIVMQIFLLAPRDQMRMNQRRTNGSGEYLVRSSTDFSSWCISQLWFSHSSLFSLSRIWSCKYCDACWVLGMWSKCLCHERDWVVVLSELCQHKQNYVVIFFSIRVLYLTSGSPSNNTMYNSKVKIASVS